MREQTASTGLPPPPREKQPAALVWGFVLLQLPVFISLAIWALSTPFVFGLCYPSLANAKFLTPEAAHINAWLSSHEPVEALNDGLKGRRLSEKEVAHFADVRVWMVRAKSVALAGLMALATLAYFARQRVSRFTDFLKAAEWRALIVLALLAGAAAGFAAWDWRTFFAWVHYPFFGATSWKLSSDSYSIILFPVKFWRAMALAVVALPGLACGGLLIVSVIAARRLNP